MPYNSTIHQLQDSDFAAEQIARRTVYRAITAKWTELTRDVDPDDEEQQKLCMARAVFSVTFWDSLTEDLSNLDESAWYDVDFSAFSL